MPSPISSHSISKPNIFRVDIYDKTSSTYFSVLDGCSGLPTQTSTLRRRNASSITARARPAWPQSCGGTMELSYGLKNGSSSAVSLTIELKPFFQVRNNGILSVLPQSSNLENGASHHMDFAPLPRGQRLSDSKEERSFCRMWNWELSRASSKGMGDHYL